jgi:tight adherence protein B
MTFLLSLAVFVLVYLFVVGLLASSHQLVKDERMREQRMAPDAMPDAVDVTRKHRVGGAGVFRKLGATHPLQALEERMWQAGIYIPVKEMLLIVLVCFIFACAATHYFFHDAVSSLAVGVAGALLPFGYIAYRRKRRLAAFLKQLPYALDLIKSSLEAGHSLQRAMQVIVDDFDDPLGTEFRTALEQTRIGLSLARALQDMLTRVPDKDLRLMVIAVKVQNEVGSSLALLIGRLSDLIRARQLMRMQIRSLTAQSRISGMIVAALPFVVLLLLSLIDPSYPRTLLREPSGWKLLKLAIAMDVAALFLVRRLLVVRY